jgi:hypothetical protein
MRNDTNYNFFHGFRLSALSREYREKKTTQSELGKIFHGGKKIFFLLQHREGIAKSAPYRSYLKNAHVG